MDKVFSRAHLLITAIFSKSDSRTKTSFLFGCLHNLCTINFNADRVQCEERTAISSEVFMIILVYLARRPEAYSTYICV